MCGIAGYIGRRDAIPVILDGLRHLEYRGYDSAGLAAISESGLVVHKVKGRIRDLADTLPEIRTSSIGIGHTRWATHGEPSVVNAHPHLDSTGRFAVVHNGIIENAAELRERLASNGVIFNSSTDTEIIAHLLAEAATDDLAAAVQYALAVVQGTYGIAVLDAESPDLMVLARYRSPVVIGVGDSEHFVASDIAAFARYTQRVIYLDDNELAIVHADEVSTRGLNTPDRAHSITTFAWEPSSYETGAFSHFMQQEIHEQPAAVARTLAGRLDFNNGTACLEDLNFDELEARSLRRVSFLGCGSAYYAGLAGAHLIEPLAGIPTDAEPASEFRYRNPIVDRDTLYVALSQSGETLDTLQAVWEIQRQGGRVVAIVNVPESSIARACERRIYLRAGPEISVTSTKSFTTTLVAITLLSLALGRLRSLSKTDGDRLLAGLQAVPGALERALEGEADVAAIAERYAHVQSAFFVGRVAGYPVALEGSQKLKEVSYIHAEAYPCAELKHGPLALVDPELPTVAVVPDDALFTKNMATLEEIRARKGPIISVGHSLDLKDLADEVIVVPKSEPELDALALLMPLQMFAYHTAVVLGLDVDKPRNLAKSVTVE